MKAQNAKDEIVQYYPKANVDIIILDNMDFRSVRNFVNEFDKKYDRLDYLLNNAGIMAQPYELSKDGHDIQFQTNHLSHFLLTKLLWEKILMTPGQSRIVQHSSVAHKIASPIFDRYHMQYPKFRYGWFGINILLVYIVFPIMGMKPKYRWLRYGVSKLSNILFMKELKYGIEKRNIRDRVISVACHPGFANTNLQYVARDSMPSYWKRINFIGSQSAADGSLPLLMATIGKHVKNGDFVGPARGGLKGLPRIEKVGGNGNDAKMSKSLWEYSEDCIEEKFIV